MILRNITNQKERILTALWIGGEVNPKELETIITKKYLPNLLYRLETEGLIKRKRYKGLRTVRLSDKGIEFVCKNYRLFANDSPSGNLYDRTVGKDEVVKKQRKARALISFSGSGIEVTNDASRLMTETTQPVYVDAGEIKRNLGPEVQGSRISGIYLTENETFRVYASDGLFQIFETTEDRIITRLKNMLMRNNDAAKLINDMVICNTIEDMLPFVNVNRQIGRNGAKLYSVSKGEENKYFIPADNCKIQLDIISDEAIRDKVINEVLSNSLGTEVTNRELTVFNDGYIISLLDLNMGNIKMVMEYMTLKNAKPVTVVWLDEYEDVFEIIFKNRVSHVGVSRGQIEEIISGR